MAYNVEITPKALRQIEDLPPAIQKRISRWMDLLSEDPRRKPSRQLQGYPDLRRVHASKDYVIIYSILDDRLVILVVRVAHRGDVYRKL